MSTPVVPERVAVDNWSGVERGTHPSTVRCKTHRDYPRGRLRETRVETASEWTFTRPLW